MSLQGIGNAIGSGIAQVANYSAQAAARANGVSAGAQAAQGTFNGGQAALANAIGSDRIAEQYAFNSAQAANANQFSEYMWDKSAAWNEQMWERMAEFNAAEAQKNRDWQEKMRATSYQTAIKDMEKAGLNPILAVTGGGVSTGAGSGSAASAGAPSMSGTQGIAASGGVMNGLAASEGNYSGQMEYMGGLLGLISAGMSGMSTALQALGGLGELGKGIGSALSQILNPDENSKQTRKEAIKDYFTNRDNWNNRWDDNDSAFNRYYNPTSEHYIGKKR